MVKSCKVLIITNLTLASLGLIASLVLSNKLGWHPAIIIHFGLGACIIFNLVCAAAWKEKPYDKGI